MPGKTDKVKALEGLASMGGPMAKAGVPEVSRVRQAYAAIQAGPAVILPLLELRKSLTGTYLEQLEALLDKLVHRKFPFAEGNVPITPAPSFPKPVYTEPDVRCTDCQCPVYFYEQQTPPLCLWCEKQRETKVLPKL